MIKNKFQKPRVTELVFLLPERIVFTSNIQEEKVDYLVKNLNPKKLQPVTAYYNGSGYILTDGNHRAKALMRMGQRFIPAVLLTKEEFDWVKFSDRIANILYKIPEKAKVYR